MSNGSPGKLTVTKRPVCYVPGPHGQDAPGRYFCEFARVLPLLWPLSRQVPTTRSRDRQINSSHGPLGYKLNTNEQHRILNISNTIFSNFKYKYITHHVYLFPVQIACHTEPVSVTQEVLIHATAFKLKLIHLINLLFDFNSILNSRIPIPLFLKVFPREPLQRR